MPAFRYDETAQLVTFVTRQRPQRGDMPGERRYKVGDDQAGVSIRQIHDGKGNRHTQVICLACSDRLRRPCHHAIAAVGRDMELEAMIYDLPGIVHELMTRDTESA